MDDTPQPERNPLTVPVSEATPEELEAQGEYHLNNAVRATIMKFSQNSEAIANVLQHFGATMHAARAPIQGSIRPAENLCAVSLHTFENGDCAVYFQPCLSAGGVVFHGSGSFGVIDSDLRVMHEYSAADFLTIMDKTVLRAVSRSLNELVLEADFYTVAFKRLDQKASEG